MFGYYHASLKHDKSLKWIKIKVYMFVFRHWPCQQGTLVVVKRLFSEDYSIIMKQKAYFPILRAIEQYLDY